MNPVSVGWSSDGLVRHGLNTGVHGVDLRPGLSELVTAAEVGDVAALDRETERIAAVRLATVGKLHRAGMSYEAIAAATSLSKSRVVAGQPLRPFAFR